MATATATVSIEAAFGDFLAEQRLLLSDSTFRKYLAIVDLLASYLDRYGYQGLGELEGRRWRAAFEAGDEQAFCRLFGPEWIPEHLGSFLGWFMNDAGLAVGDLTHGIGVLGLPVPGLSFGTDMGGIFNLIGTGYKLVTLDGRAASCSNPLGI